MVQETKESTAIVVLEKDMRSYGEVLRLQEAVIRCRDIAVDRTVTTLLDTKDATNDLTIMSNLKKELESYRLVYTRPRQNELKEINAYFKLISDPLAEAEKVTKDKMLAFNKEQERIRLEQEEVNRLRIEAAQKEAALHNGEISESVNLVEVAPEATKRVSTDMGTIGQRDNWTYEVFDFTILPDEYKVVDNVMLNTIAKKHHDQKQIPGVRFVNKPIIAVRARKED